MSISFCQGFIYPHTPHMKYKGISDITVDIFDPDLIDLDVIKCKEAKIGNFCGHFGIKKEPTSSFKVSSRI